MKKITYFKEQPFTKTFLLIGAAFFLFEFFLHMVGLPILEHDIIYLFTHDGYIGLLSLTYAILLVIVSLDLEKYDTLFKISMIGILIGVGIATSISYKGGYSEVFPVVSLDKDISFIGLGFLIWYPITLIMKHFKK